MSNTSLCVNMSSVLGTYKNYLINNANGNVDKFVSEFNNMDLSIKCSDFEEAVTLIKSKDFKLNRQDMRSLKEKGQNGFNIGVIAAISMLQFERRGFLADFGNTGGVELVRWLVQDSAKDFSDLSRLYRIAFNHVLTPTNKDL
jgi:hypothetical protein